MSVACALYGIPWISGLGYKKNAEYKAEVKQEGLYFKGRYSRTPVTRTLKGHEKQFELVGVQVIGVA